MCAASHEGQVKGLQVLKADLRYIFPRLTQFITFQNNVSFCISVATPQENNVLVKTKTKRPILFDLFRACGIHTQIISNALWKHNICFIFLKLLYRKAGIDFKWP